MAHRTLAFAGDNSWDHGVNQVGERVHYSFYGLRLAIRVVCVLEPRRQESRAAAPDSEICPFNILRFVKLLEE